MGVPPNHLLKWDFSINHLFWGTPFLETPIYMMMMQTNTLPHSKCHLFFPDAF